VAAILGTGVETQFQFQEIPSSQRPFRDVVPASIQRRWRLHLDAPAVPKPIQTEILKVLAVSLPNK
jgi:hypothetical protein